MDVTRTELDGVVVLKPQVFGDERGWFTESFNCRRFREVTGHSGAFVQDNHSRSEHGVLRGIHFQTPAAAQGKLIRATRGEIFDVAVDLRQNSPTFGQWYGVRLSADNHRQLWVPVGFGHAFLVLSSVAEVQYKVDEHWSPDHERSLLWSDPAIGITWPDVDNILLSEKDERATTLKALKKAGDLFQMGSESV